MSAVSRPVLYGGVLALAVGLYYWSSDDSTPAAKAKTKKTKTKVEKVDTEFTPDEYTVHFAKAQPVARNVFLPLVKSQAPTVIPVGAINVPKDLDKIPSSLADGDGNWIYSGYASVNNEDLALLENKTSKQSAFVKNGESWKSAHVVHISSSSIVLAGKDGVQQVILRFDPYLAAKKEATKNTPTAGSPGTLPPAGPMGSVPPFNPGSPLRGPINPNVQFQSSPDGAMTIIR